jgi:sortase A
LRRTRVVGGALVTAGVLVLGASLLLPSLSDSIIAREQGVFAETAPLQSHNVSAKSSALSVATVFAKLYVPRFGARYVHAVAEGTSLNKVLNRVGIGHYQSTQMPGETGNFALAGHRAGNGGPFRLIDTFKNGDLAYVETADTWFTYRYLQTKVVKPSAIGVIYPKPVGLTAKSQSDSFLTLTSCTPIHVNTDRIVSWFELVEQHSKQDGPPARLSWLKN